MEKEKNSGYERLDSQINWYDSKSRWSQRCYKIGKLLVIVLASAIPVFSVIGFNYLVAAFGAMIAISESVQHLYQWHHNWITYRSTCEALRHEKYTYLERANPYDIPSDTEARKLLVERTESLISTEHSKWIANQEEAAKNSVLTAPRSSRSPD